MTDRLADAKAIGYTEGAAAAQRVLAEADVSPENVAHAAGYAEGLAEGLRPAAPTPADVDVTIADAAARRRSIDPAAQGGPS